jgi:hypothetical protein
VVVETNTQPNNNQKDWNTNFSKSCEKGFDKLFQKIYLFGSGTFPSGECDAVKIVYMEKVMVSINWITVEEVNAHYTAQLEANDLAQICASYLWAEKPIQPQSRLG